jgi:hypothetical protein
MACADEADGADGICGKVLAQPLVKREERRLHGLHEEAVMEAGGGENLLKLPDIEGGGFLAEDVLLGSESANAELGVAVGVGGDVDGVNAGGEKLVERGCDVRDGKSLGICAGSFGIAAPNGPKACVWDSLEPLSKARGGTAGADDAEADLQFRIRLPVCHRFRVQRCAAAPCWRPV